MRAVVRPSVRDMGSVRGRIPAMRRPPRQEASAANPTRLPNVATQAGFFS